MFGSIQRAIVQLSVNAQAHAQLIQNQSAVAVGTVTNLVIFSDLDDSSHTSTLADTVAVLNRRSNSDFDDLVSMVVFDPPAYMQSHDPALMTNIANTRNTLEQAVDFLVSATDTAQLVRAFQDIAETANNKANAFYELSICPPQRAGIHQLTVEVNDPRYGDDRYTRTLTTTFDATGFSNECKDKHNNAIYQQETSSLCRLADRKCGFVKGVFCGICDMVESTTMRVGQVRVTPATTVAPATTITTFNYTLD
eukprot:SAG25_NODE_163_length_13199_cov_5.774122_9_plen_252_part_00